MAIFLFHVKYELTVTCISLLHVKHFKLCMVCSEDRALPHGKIVNIFSLHVKPLSQIVTDPNRIDYMCDRFLQDPEKTEKT